ncbi:DUF429 domain-containing protein [Chthonobacter albigriseus]|uniref:DUF429 domain-containing protein n=1 Tax=Chthonobacter albigriseus TaxID=1683161 RepID=UPI0015EF30DE
MIVAGVDGCPAGWIAVLRDLDTGAADVRVVARIADLLDRPGEPQVIAVDMPIGLPDRVALGGRPAERAVRGMLGPRQSSVFSVPSRSAVEAPDYPAACAAARATSEPPRAVSKQCFHLFPKIREIDDLLTERAALADRIFESHPEVAFTVLGGGQPMTLPKKIKSRVNPAGLEERRAFLAGRGLDRSLLDARPPRGAAADDLLDASVCTLVAERLAAGVAIPHPAEDVRDGRGLRIAIWT